MIKAGFLSVPEFDEVASKNIYRLLRKEIPGLRVVENASAQSQQYWVEDILRRWCDETELDLIITIGGTFPAAGPSPDEIVPEATRAVLERFLPGLSEAMRASAASSEHAMLAVLDRGICGIRGRTVIINLPKGAGAATLFLGAVGASISSIIQCLQEEHCEPDVEKMIREGIREGTFSRDGDGFSERSQTAEPFPSHTKAKKCTLNPDEFAAYLRRNRSADVEG